MHTYILCIQISIGHNPPCIKVQQSKAQAYTIIIRVNPSIRHYSKVDHYLKINNMSSFARFSLTQSGAALYVSPFLTNLHFNFFDVSTICPHHRLTRVVGLSPVIPISRRQRQAPSMPVENFNCVFLPY